MEKNCKDYYGMLSEQAKLHSKLFQYTNDKGLFCMLEQKQLRLSRLDTVNDPEENERITSPCRGKVFVACFTHESNDEYFYDNYGNIKIEVDPFQISCEHVYYDSTGNNEISLIKLTPEEWKAWEYNRENDAGNWTIWDISWCDIYYTDDMSMHIAEDGMENNAGIIKRRIGKDQKGNARDWSKEKETRLRIAIKLCGMPPISPNLWTETEEWRKRPEYIVPQFKYLYVSLPWSAIVGITISPKMKRAERDDILLHLREIGFPMELVK